MISSFHIIMILVTSIIIDFIFGDPRNRFHPVAWLGRIINYFVPKLKNQVQYGDNIKIEKERGIVFTISIIAICVFLVQISLIFLSNISIVVVIGISIFILYITISIKSLNDHVKTITIALNKNDIADARKKLSMIVSRDTKNLDEQHIFSGIIESIADSTVDGIVSPIFYFSIFGPTGALSFRVINTLDSIIGYKEKYFVNIGWMPAKMDTYVNYIPARITSVIMIIAAIIVNADWKNAIKIFRKDRNKTASLNSGYPISVLSGALRIRLEKINHYSIGISYERISVEKCKVAIKIMRVTTILFSFMIAIPIIILLGTVRWWSFIFGVQ